MLKIAETTGTVHTYAYLENKKIWIGFNPAFNISYIDDGKLNYLSFLQLK